jgi:hypothetical protein
MLDQDLVSQEYFYNFLTGKYSIAVMRRLQRNLKEARLNITSEQWSIMYNLWVERGAYPAGACCSHISR